MKRQRRYGPVGDPALRTASDPTCGNCGFVVCACGADGIDPWQPLYVLDMVCALELRPGWHRKAHYCFPIFYSRRGTPSVYQQPCGRWCVESNCCSSCDGITYTTLESAMMRAERLAAGDLK